MQERELDAYFMRNYFMRNEETFALLKIGR